MSFGGSIKLTGESEYTRAIARINQQLREIGSEMKAVSSQFDKNDKSEKALAAQTEVLTKQLSAQQEKVKTLEARYSSMREEYEKNEAKHKALVNSYIDAKSRLADLARTVGTTSDEYKAQQKVVEDLANEVKKSTDAQDRAEKSMSDMRTTINKAQADANNTARSIENLGKETADAGKEAEDASEGFTIFKGTLANLTATAITAALDGLTKLAKALIDVGEQAISSYGEYEQLVGGVETLFGDAAEDVKNYAKIAYKTAGVSANQYMRQVTTFSASLLQSLGKDTKKAAKYADMAIRDMADNANKMGTDLSSIQTAYSSLSRQQYQTLDNLRIGYGGTRKEAERLIADANKLKEANGELGDLSVEKFGDMIEAIHLIQEEMGITGTTAQEAANTIQGSTGSMKAAWENLLTGIADDNQDMGELVDNFVDSLMASAENIIPRIKKVVEGIKRLAATIVNDVFPRLKKEVPELAPLISAFEWIIENRKAILTAIQVIIAAFAVKKIIEFTKAVKEATQAVIAFGKANISSGFGTASAVILGIAAGLALVTKHAGESADEVSALTSRWDEMVGTLNNTNEALRDQATAYDELRTEREKAIGQNDAEMTYYRNLWDELQKIVDENGKVQAGYETRAQFIAGELKNALGIEIQYQDGIITGYQNARKEVANLIEQKRAQFVLEKQEEAYREAQEKMNDATREAVRLEGELIESKDKLSETTREYNALQASLREAGMKYHNDENYYLTASVDKLKEAGDAIASSVEQYRWYGEEINILKAKIEGGWEDANGNIVKGQEQLYQEALGLVQKYQYDSAVYLHNYEEFVSGHYDNLITLQSDYALKYEKTLDGQLDAAKDQLELYNAQLLAAIKSAQNDSTGVMSGYAKELGKTVDAMQINYDLLVKATEEGLSAAKVEWNDGIASMLSLASGQKVEFKKTSDGLLQMYINGVKEGGALSVDEWEKILNSSILEVSSYTDDFYGTAVYLIDGFTNGLADRPAKERAFRTINSLADQLVAAFKKPFNEHSPSKVSEQIAAFFVEGFGVGIDREEDSVLAQVSRFGQEIIDELKDELADGVSLGEVNYGDANLPQLSRRADIRAEGQQRESLVEAFKEALAEMKIELDDEVAGKFVERTVERAVYNF